MNYEERQKQWLEENDVKVGSRVKVTRKAETWEDGWGTIWDRDMDALVGQDGEVLAIESEMGLAVRFENRDSWYFPFFVLEPVSTARNGLRAFTQAVKVLIRGGRLKTSCGIIGMEDDGTLYAVGHKDTPDGVEEVHLRCDVDVKQLVDLAKEMGHDDLWLQNCGAALTESKT